MAKHHNPIDEAIMSSSAGYPKKTWYDQITPELQTQLAEVKTKFRNGEYPHPAVVVCRVVRDAVLQGTGRHISEDAVKRWLAR